MRSPDSGYSNGVRYVNLNGGVSRDSAVSGGHGVRPALLSEKLCVRRPRSTRMMCVVPYMMAVPTSSVQSVVASACAPLSFQRETMRSPYSGDSYGVRGVNHYGYVNSHHAVSGGFGVRPLSFRRNYAFAVRRQFV